MMMRVQTWFDFQFEVRFVHLMYDVVDRVVVYTSDISDGTGRRLHNEGINDTPANNL